MILYYIKILRPINILISWCAILVCAIILDVVSQINYIIITFITVGCFIGGANVFNDIQDISEDKVNKPYRPLPSRIISESSAIIFYKILFLIAFCMCLFLPLYAIIVCLLICSG